MITERVDSGIRNYTNQRSRIISQIKNTYLTPRFNIYETAGLRISFQRNLLHVMPTGLPKEAFYAPLNLEMPEARFVSRSFLRINVGAISIPTELLFERKTFDSTLYPLFDLAEQEKVNQLSERLDQGNLRSQGFIIERPGKEEYAPPMIPGEFKHYTDKKGYEAIMSEGMVRGSRRVKGRIDDYYVSVSKVSLPPNEVARVLFTKDEMRKITGRGTHVIAFDLKDGLPEVNFLRSDESLEGWVPGNLSLSDVNVSYAGQNILAI